MTGKRSFMNSCIIQMSLVSIIQKIMCFISQLVMQRIHKWISFIFMHKKINMFKITRILVVWVVWILICLLQTNMLHKMLLCLKFHHIFYVTQLHLIIGSILPVIFEQILWEKNGEQRCRWKIFQWKIEGAFDIFKDISDHVTLGQLIDTSDNVNQAVSITGPWIYDPNYKIPFLFMRQYLDITSSS